MKLGTNIWLITKLQHLNLSSSLKKDTSLNFKNLVQAYFLIPAPLRHVGPVNLWSFADRKKFSSQWRITKKLNNTGRQLTPWKPKRGCKMSKICIKNFLNKRGIWESVSRWHLQPFSKGFREIVKNSLNIDLRMLRDLWRETQIFWKIC